MKMTKENLSAFRRDFAKTVAELEKTYNVSLNLGNIRFNSNQFDTKLTVVNRDEAGARIDPIIAEFKRTAHFYGLSRNDIGREFYSNGNIFKIVGLKVSYRKYPIIAENLQGKRFKFTPEHIKMNMK